MKKPQETTTKPEENKIYCLNDNPIICGTPDHLLDEAVLELKTTQHFITADNFPTEWLLQRSMVRRNIE